MNFWLLTSEFPPLFGGGISTYCAETAKMFAVNDHAVTVFTQDQHIGIREESADGFRIIRFNPSQFYTESFLGYEAQLSYAFAQVVRLYIEKEAAPDILEAQEYLGIAYYLLQFKHLGYDLFKDLRVVVTLHSPAFLYFEYNKVNFHRLPMYWVGEMEKFCITAADQLISPSQYLVDEIGKRMDLSQVQAAIIKNPFKIDWPCPQLAFTPGKFVFFGKLTPQKGCLELIKYFKHFWDSGNKFKLVMVGGGDHLYHPEGIDMIDFIRQHYKKEVGDGLLQLPGMVKPAELSRYLADAQAVIVPSLVDNLPYTVIEAMSGGKIVLASRQGGQSELITDEKDGFLFDHEEAKSFPGKIRSISSLGKQESQTIANNAYQKIREECSFEKIYPQKSGLLDRLIRECKPRNSFPFLYHGDLAEQPGIPAIGKDPLLSVVIPYFNMGKYLGETIESISNSSYENIEIIVVDDGSNEAESKEILAVLSKRYPIKVITQENIGLALARNNGALQAKGELLAFLDADDTVEKEYYEKAVGVFGKLENVSFVGCWAKYFGGANGYWPAFTPEPPYLLFHNMVNSSALIYKKLAFLRNGLNDPKMIFGMEDYESVLNLVAHGYHGVVLPEPLWNYRVRKKSMARQFTREKQLYLYRLIAGKHRSLFSTHATELLGLVNANGVGFGVDNPTLIYDLPGRSVVARKMKKFIVAQIKSRPWLRKIAIKVKKRIYKK